jgi:lipopolysaccharide export system permease protein
MMVPILGRYLSARFVASFALALGALTALALTLDLMEEADRVLETPRGGILGLLWYSALRLPDIFGQMLPIATLLGIVIMLGRLLRHNELVTIWGGGVSPLQIMAQLLPAALLLGLLGYLNADYAVPKSRESLRTWGVGEARKTGILADDGKLAWMRSGTDIVRTPKQASPTGELRDITVFRRDVQGRLLDRIDAARAVPENGGWQLFDVRRVDIGAAATSQVPELFWDGRIDVAALPLIVSDMRDLRSGQLLSLIRNEGYGQRPAYRFSTWLQSRVAGTLTPALMVFLAVALAQRFRRTGVFATLLLAGIGIGFAFFALDGVAFAMGEAGLLPPWFAAWGPKAALGGLVGTILLSNEA